MIPKNCRGGEATKKTKKLIPITAIALLAGFLLTTAASATTLTARFIGRPQVLADNSTVPFADQIPEGLWDGGP